MWQFITVDTVDRYCVDSVDIVDRHCILCMWSHQYAVGPVASPTQMTFHSVSFHWLVVICRHHARQLHELRGCSTGWMHHVTHMIAGAEPDQPLPCSPRSCGEGWRSLLTIVAIY